THPNVAISLNTLADLYRAQGYHEEARLLGKRALALREQALGPTHPDVAESLNTLAQVYEDQGQDSEALPLIQRALAILAHALPDHPHTAMAQEQLAALLRRMGS